MNLQKCGLQPIALAINVETTYTNLGLANTGTALICALIRNYHSADYVDWFPYNYCCLCVCRRVSFSMMLVLLDLAVSTLGMCC